VPGYPPAIELRRHLGELLLDPTMHGYTPILGLPPLRENYAAHLSAFLRRTDQGQRGRHHVGLQPGFSAWH